MINMTLKDILIRNNVIEQVKERNSKRELPLELRIKVIRLKSNFNKIKKQFDADLKEFTDSIIPEKLRDLASKEDKTDSEKKEFDTLNNKVNTEYQEFIKQKELEEVSFNEEYFNIDEYTEILDINSDNNVTINGNKLSAADFLELFYELFIK